MSYTAFQQIGQIVGTNTVRIPRGSDAMSAAIGLLDAHVAGAPVVDRAGRYVGFVSEEDLLRAVHYHGDLKNVMVADIMSRTLDWVSPSTPIEKSLQLMEQKHLSSIPVVDNEILITTVSQHDLLRGILGVGLGIEQ